MNRKHSVFHILISIIFLLSIISTSTLAETDKSVTENITQGFVKYQAGRIENIILESVIDKIRYRYSFQILFPLTSQVMKEYTGMSSKRLIPLMQHYIKQDVGNFNKFSHCIVYKITNQGTIKSYSQFYEDTKNHFTKKDDSSNSAYKHSVDAYLKNQGDECITEMSLYDNNDPAVNSTSNLLDVLLAELKSKIINKSSTIVAGLFNSWYMELFSNNEIIQIIKNIPKSKINTPLLEKFIEMINKDENENYFNWLTTTSLTGNPSIPSSSTFTYKSFELLINNNREIYQFISKNINSNLLDIFRDQYTKGHKALLYFFDTEKLNTNNVIISRLFGNWEYILRNNENILKQVKELNSDNINTEIVKNFINERIKENSTNNNFYAWLSSQLDIPEKMTVSDFKKIIDANNEIYIFLKGKVSSIDKSTAGKKYKNAKTRIEQYYKESKSLVSPQEACKKDVDNLRTCQIVNLIYRINDLKKSQPIDSLNSEKMHAFLMIIKTFDIEKQYEDDISSFRRKAMFLVDILDAAAVTPEDDSDPSEAVAKAIDAFVDEDQVYLDKRKYKSFSSNFNRNWYRNSFYISSYFGVNSISQGNEHNLDTDVRFYGPLGIEYKILSSNNIVLGFNYSPFDFGSAISNELQDNTYENNLSATSTASAFFSITLRNAPVSFLLGRQFDVVDANGRSDDIDFIGVSFDLPLVTIF